MMEVQSRARWWRGRLVLVIKTRDFKRWWLKSGTLLAGEKITNLMELSSEGELKTTTKKSSGVNIRVMKVEGNEIRSENNLTKNDGTKVVSSEVFSKMD